MGISIRLFDESLDTGIEWTGAVWRRDDNGQASAYVADLIRAWCEDFIRDGGDDPTDYEDEIDSAVSESGTWDTSGLAIAPRRTRCARGARS